MARPAPTSGQVARRHEVAPLFHDSRRLRIGLFGGSFNPAHEGHLHVSELAARALELDEVWWLVSPQNPLKPTGDMAGLQRRILDARRLAGARAGIRVFAPEVHFGSTLTWRTIATMTRRCPRHRFCWIMGADNLAGFTRWRRHRLIVASIPIAVIDRPGYSYEALSRGRLVMRARRTPRRLAAGMRAGNHAPAWCFIAGRRHHASATDLRRARARDAFVESANR